MPVIYTEKDTRKVVNIIYTICFIFISILSSIFFSSIYFGYKDFIPERFPVPAPLIIIGAGIALSFLFLLPSFIVISIFIYFKSRGASLTIDLAGINFSRRYIGPIQSMEEVNIFTNARLNDNELIIPWKDMSQIKFFISRSTFSQIPNYYYFVVCLKNNTRYAKITARIDIIEKIKESIMKIGKGNYIESGDFYEI